MFFNKTKKLLEVSESSLMDCQTDLNNCQLLLTSSKQELACSQEQHGNTSAKLESTISQLADTQNKLAGLVSKYAPIIDQDSALSELNTKIEQAKVELQVLADKYQRGLVIYNKLDYELNLYQDTLEIGTFGLFTPQFNFVTSEEYKTELLSNYEKQKKLVKDDLAAICNTKWTVGGSEAEGRRMVSQYKKLMLYAFNGECDSCIAKVKWNNAGKTKERIEKAFENINKLGQTQNVYLSQQLLALKIEDLSLTHEYELKLHAEKEEQRRIREQMREEEKAQRDFERAQREAEDEEKRYQRSLDKAKQEMAGADASQLISLQQQVNALEVKLKAAQENKERAISMAQQTKAGHIYVISNIGSFGDDVYKIGMTRRLDPMDRVRELGDASVPFHFDIHAIIYSDNAPQLEWEIHQKFQERRLNRINGRREFFRVTLDEIEAVVKEHYDAEISFTKLADAKEYRETLTMIEQLKAAIEKQEQAVAKFPGSLDELMGTEN